MRILTCLAALSAAVFASGCGETPNSNRQQEKVINGFYQQHIKNHSNGIPGPDELKQIQPYLSQALFALLSKASDIEVRYHAAAATPVPPLVDGDLFTSLFEGATSFSLDSCESEESRATCLVRMRHTASADEKNSSDERWTDKLLLIKENQQWRIDDIEFVGNDQSAQHEYLSDTLNSVINDYQ